MAQEQCKHESVRFLECTAADRLPGCWVCNACGEKMTTNPKTGMRYLEFPNLKLTKVLPKWATGGKY